MFGDEEEDDGNNPPQAAAGHGVVAGRGRRRAADKGLKTTLRQLNIPVVSFHAARLWIDRELGRNNDGGGGAARGKSRSRGRTTSLRPLLKANNDKKSKRAKGETRTRADRKISLPAKPVVCSRREGVFFF